MLLLDNGEQSSNGKLNLGSLQNRWNSIYCFEIVWADHSGGSVSTTNNTTTSTITLSSNSNGGLNIPANSTIGGLSIGTINICGWVSTTADLLNSSKLMNGVKPTAIAQDILLLMILMVH